MKKPGKVTYILMVLCALVAILHSMTHGDWAGIAIIIWGFCGYVAGQTDGRRA